MSDSSRGGILASLRRILDVGVAMVETRLELLTIEAREERGRLVEAVLWAAAAVALAMMTLILLTCTVVVVFWDSARVPALLSLSLLYLVAMLLAWRGLRTKLNAPAGFSASLGELRKDRTWLGPGS